MAYNIWYDQQLRIQNNSCRLCFLKRDFTLLGGIKFSPIFNNCIPSTSTHTWVILSFTHLVFERLVRIFIQILARRFLLVLSNLDRVQSWAQLAHFYWIFICKSSIGLFFYDDLKVSSKEKCRLHKHFKTLSHIDRESIYHLQILQISILVSALCQVRKWKWRNSTYLNISTNTAVKMEYIILEPPP